MDSYTVQAVLTLKDNMSAGFKNAAASMGAFGSKTKSAIGLGAAMQVGMKAVSATMSIMSNHIGDAVNRYDQLNRFPNVMKNLGISARQSKSALKELDAGIAGLPTTLDSATQGVTRFVSKNGDIKKSTKYFLAMNNAIVAGGQSTELQSAAIEQLSQAYAKGKMDMIEWRSICNAMPAQMNMVAKAMGMSTDKLGEGLRNGTISMDEFMDTMVRLNKEGVDGFASFEDQALTAVGGIKTAFTRMNLAVTRGLANCIGAVDTMLKNNGFEGGIASLFTKGIGKIDKVFAKAAGAIEKVNLKGIISGLTPAFETLKMAAKAAGKVISKVAGFLNKHAEGVSSMIPVIIAGAAAFKAYKKISSWFVPLSGATEEMNTFGNSTRKAKKASLSLKKGLASLAKNAGVALIIGALAALAFALKGIASLGTTAVAPLLTFGVVVGGLAAIFAALGTKLKTSMEGILLFAAAVSAMAIAMSPIAQSGKEGAIAMGVFGIVVAGLAAVFAIFGTALNVASVGMLAFGAMILMVGAGMRLATPFVQALTSMIGQLGNTISQVASTIAGAVSQIVSTTGGTLCAVMTTAGNVIAQVAQAISDGFLKICEGAAQVVDAISGGLASVLNSIAGVIESIGNSARNAGAGFKSVAEGISMIAKLSILDIAKSLAAVATGLGSISSSGKNLPEVSAGMQSLVSSITIGAVNIAAFNAALTVMSGMIDGIVTSVNTLKSAFGNFVITPPNIGPFVAAFNQIVASAMMIIPALTAAGRRAGTGLASGLSAGTRQAQSAMMSAIASITASLSALPARFAASGRVAGVGFATGLQTGLTRAVAVSKQTVTQINAALKSAQSGSYAAGRNIGIGLANGMRSQLGAVRSVAAQLASAAEAAIRAKAKIHSPSKISTKLGTFWAVGWINSIRKRIADARKATARLVSIPNIRQPQFAMSYGGYSGELSSDYSYGSSDITVEVPLTVDGREFARATATYTQDELGRLEMRNSRKRGIR